MEFCVDILPAAKKLLIIKVGQKSNLQGRIFGFFSLLCDTVKIDNRKITRKLLADHSPKI